MFRLIGSAFLLCAATLFSQTAGPASDGEALFQKQDWQGATRAFQSAVEQNPHDGRSWFRLGSSLYRLGHNDESRQAYEKSVENKFQAPYAMAVVARSYAHDSDAAKAAE